MSFETKKDDSLEQELNEIKYHELKAKLTELNVGDAFKHGLPKKDIIQKAIEKLNEIKEIEKDVDSQDSEIVKVELEKREQAKADAEAKEVEEKEAAELTELQKIELSVRKKFTVHGNLDKAGLEADVARLVRSLSSPNLRKSQRHSKYKYIKVTEKLIKEANSLVPPVAKDN